MINNRVIGLANNERNFKVLHPNPTFSIHSIDYKRYKNNKIFQMADNTPSIMSRVGMYQNVNLIAQPCETINTRSNNRQFGGFSNDNFKVKSGTGLSSKFFTEDRLGFSRNLKQKPLINSIY